MFPVPSVLADEPVKCLAFAAVIFFANVIQAVTGFAGVMLALPPSMLLFGPDMAKAAVNAVNWAACAYLAWHNRAYLVRREFFRIIGWMLAGIAAGLWLYGAVDAALLIPLYGAIIIAVALKNLLLKRSDRPLPRWAPVPILFGAGVIHGMFVSGGALLVLYLAATFRDKHAFRANASAVWAVLNLFLMIADFEKGLYDAEFFTLTALAFLPLGAAVWLGNAIHSRINQSLFNHLTYGLLLLSGAMIILW